MQKFTEAQKRAIEQALAKHGELKVKLDELIKEIGANLSTAGGIIRDGAEKARGYSDDRSDEWHESDRGQAYDLWVDELEEAAGELEKADNVEDFSELSELLDLEDKLEAVALEFEF